MSSWLYISSSGRPSFVPICIRMSQDYYYRKRKYKRTCKIKQYGKATTNKVLMHCEISCIYIYINIQTETKKYHVKYTVVALQRAN